MMSIARLLSFIRLPRPPNSTLFPYTTLFRSALASGVHADARAGKDGVEGGDVDDPATVAHVPGGVLQREERDRKSTRLNSSHPSISYAVFCLKKKNGRENTGHVDNCALADLA